MSRRRLPAAIRWVVVPVFLFVSITAILQLSEWGRVFTVRSYVRADRLWEHHFPVSSAKPLFRRLDAPLSRLGLVHPVRVQVEPGVSLMLDPSDDIGRTILVSRTGKWEPEVWAAISSGLSAGATFFDVGAHIGYDSLKASRMVGRDGQVVAFEPNPETLMQLRANIQASGAANVIVQPIACSDKEEQLTLFDSTPGGNSGSSSLSQENAGAGSQSYRVRARPIDHVVNELGLTRVDVLKADVEGAELLVLRGATTTLSRFRPKLILEIVPRQLANMNTSVEELEAFLKELGYTAGRAIDYKNKEYSAR